MQNPVQDYHMSLEFINGDFGDKLEMKSLAGESIAVRDGS